MNFLGHGVVARRAGMEGAQVRGSMLPDLAAVAGFRLDMSLASESISQGWRCHVHADRLFHASSEFKDGTSDIASALGRWGWERWQSVGVAHIGWELLLDGFVARHCQPDEWFELSMGDIVPMARSHSDVDRWARLIARHARRPLWTDYLSADAIGARVHSRLFGTRIAFGEGRISELVKALQLGVEGVERSAESLISVCCTGYADLRAKQAAAVADR